MIKKECYIWVGHIVEYRGMTLRKVRPGKYVVIPRVPWFLDPFILTRAKI